MEAILTAQSSPTHTKIKRFTTQRLDSNIEKNIETIGKIIGERYLIKDVLPSIDDLNCYLVKDLLNNNLCGICGAENFNSPSPYCNQCGFLLKDSNFLMLEGHFQNTEAFEELINKDINHKAIIRFFNRFYFHEKYYVIAQKIGIENLFNFEKKSLNKLQIIQWADILSDALDYLHKQKIYNVEMSLNHVPLLPQGPCLLNFSDSKYTEDKTESTTLSNSDIKSLGTMLLSLLAKTQLDFPKFKEFCLNATGQEFRTVSEFRLKLLQLKTSLRATKIEPVTQKAIFVNDKGVSISMGKASDVGIVRNLNEDSIAAFELTNILQSVSIPFGLYMVADGMGGHEAGEEASKIAVETITKKLTSVFSQNFNLSSQAIKKILLDAIFYANDVIVKTAAQKNNSMGTTITLALIKNNDAFIINIGDARTYVYKKGNIQLITEDHSFVYRLYKIGQLTFNEIAQHPSRNQILCALGENNLEQILNNMAQQANHPYYFKTKLKKDEGLLLCSDGLWQMVTEKEIIEVLDNCSHPQQAVDELINMANKNGGDDNISIIYVQLY